MKFLKVGVQDAFLLATVLGIYGAQLDGYASDPGVGWHLMTGKLIAESGVVPKVDPFLVSATVRPWISDQWLSDLALWNLFSAGSWELLALVLPLLFVLIFGVVLYRGVSAFSGSALAATVATVLALKVAQIHMVLRPVIFGFLFFIPLYLVVQELYRKPDFWLRRLMLLAPAFVIWANMHPSFALGLVVLAIATVAYAMQPLFSPGEGRILFDGKGTFQLFAVTVVCGLVTLLNPYGLDLHRSILWLSSSDFFMRFHQEWMSPDFRNLEGELFKATVLILIAGAVLVRKRTFTLLDIGLLTGLGMMALDAVRVLPYFAVVATVPVARCLAGLGDLQSKRLEQMTLRFRNAVSWINRREKQSSCGLLGLGAALSLVALMWFRSGTPTLSDGIELRPSSKSYPYGALEYLTAHSTEHSTESRVFATPNWGGFITLQGRGIVRPIMDDRNTLLGEQAYRDYFSALESQQAVLAYADKNRLTHLLLESSSPLAREIAARGSLLELYRGTKAVIFSVQVKSQ